jgi:hypothetical protein
MPRLGCTTSPPVPWGTHLCSFYHTPSQLSPVSGDAYAAMAIYSATEKRAVLHVALRAPKGQSIIVDGEDLGLLLFSRRDAPQSPLIALNLTDGGATVPFPFERGGRYQDLLHASPFSVNAGGGRIVASFQQRRAGLGTLIRSAGSQRVLAFTRFS